MTQITSKMIKEIIRKLEYLLYLVSFNTPQVANKIKVWMKVNATFFGKEEDLIDVS